LGNQFHIKKTGSSYILYDANVIAEPPVQLFDCDYHTKSSNQQKYSTSHTGGIGRARVVYLTYQDQKLILKHYYRGGLVARFVKDSYLGFSIEKTRAFREFRLLKKMYKLGLPVPVAVAARVDKGLFSYRADLVTREIEQVKTLADMLSSQKIDDYLWQEVGACIKRFHQHDIYHADLNARNILLDEAKKLYLIDFDNSTIRSGSASWKMANLARLQRSLLKFCNNTPGFHFTESNWLALLEGYNK
jgi:3-deoxy-D-manno-octulosonic acid kinase